MRKITCECCMKSKWRRYESAIWYIFGVALCDRCRLAVVFQLQEWGIGIGESHPVMDEFTDTGTVTTL